MWKLQIIGWSLYFLLMFFSFLSRETDQSIAYTLMVKSFRTAVGFMLSYGLWLIYSRIFNKYTLPKLVTVAVCASLVLGILWTVLETLFFWLTLHGYDLHQSLQYKPRVAVTYAVTLLAWSAIYFGIEYWKQAQKEQRRTLQAKLMAETAQLEMLRYQLNPHFLFNALNSIRASISPDNQTSRQMITELAEFLRHSLLTKDDVLSTLEDEMEAIQNYLAIEKVRFEEALEINFCIDETTKGAMIPSFILNPLVENAIKHGFRSGTEVLHIRISAQYDTSRVDGTKKLIIEIANTGKLDNKKQTKDGAIGLKNVRARLEKQLPGQTMFTLEQKGEEVIACIEINPTGSAK